MEQRCDLCGKRVDTSHPYIMAEELNNIYVHVSCLYTARPLDILRMLQIDFIFLFMTGEMHTSLADMYPHEQKGKPDEINGQW